MVFVALPVPGMALISSSYPYLQKSPYNDLIFALPIVWWRNVKTGSFIPSYQVNTILRWLLDETENGTNLKLYVRGGKEAFKNKADSLMRGLDCTYVNSGAAGVAQLFNWCLAGM